MKSLLLLLVFCLIGAVCLAGRPPHVEDPPVVMGMKSRYDPCQGLDLRVEEYWLRWLQRLQRSQSSITGPKLDQLEIDTRFRIELCKAFKRDFPPPSPPPVTADTYHPPPAMGTGTGSGPEIGRYSYDDDDDDSIIPRSSPSPISPTSPSAEPPAPRDYSLDSNHRFNRSENTDIDWELLT